MHHNSNAQENSFFLGLSSIIKCIECWDVSLHLTVSMRKLCQNVKLERRETLKIGTNLHRWWGMCVWCFDRLFSFFSFIYLLCTKCAMHTSFLLKSWWQNEVNTSKFDDDIIQSLVLIFSFRSVFVVYDFLSVCKMNWIHWQSWKNYRAS